MFSSCPTSALLLGQQQKRQNELMTLITESLGRPHPPKDADPELINSLYVCLCVCVCACFLPSKDLHGGVPTSV